MRAVCTLTLALALATPAGAQIITETLDGSTHPIDAGWSYLALGNGLTATSAFTVADGMIEQHTLGAGYAGQGGNYCYKDFVLNHPSAWTLRARIRIVASEIWSFPFGSYMAFGSTGFGLMSTTISPFNVSWVNYPFAGTSWHDIRIETAACGRWTLFVDDAPLHEGLGANTQGVLTLAFGDGTGGANADALIDSLELTVNLGVGADFDGSGTVDGADLGVLLSAWGQPGVTDLDCSGTTDGGDLGVLLSSWGAA